MKDQRLFCKICHRALCHCSCRLCRFYCSWC